MATHPFPAASPAIPERPASHHCSTLSLHVNTALIAPLTLRAPPPCLDSNSLLSANHFGYLRYPWQRTCAMNCARGRRALSAHVQREPGFEAEAASAREGVGRRRRKRKSDTRDWSGKVGGAGLLAGGGCDWRGPGHGGRSSGGGGGGSGGSGGGGRAAPGTDGFSCRSLGSTQCSELCSTSTPPLGLELQLRPSGPQRQGWRAHTPGTAQPPPSPLEKT